MANLPPLPAGFALDEQKKPAMPPPPPGFTVDGGDPSALFKQKVDAANADLNGRWDRGSILPIERNQGTGEYRPAIPQMALDVLDALSLPHDVYTGKTDPMSEEGMNRALGMAGLLTTGTEFGPSGRLINAAGENVPKTVSKALKRDGIAPETIPARRNAIGPEAILGDLGTNVRAATAALATVPGKAQTMVTDALGARARQAPTRLTGAVDEALGPSSVPSAVQADIKASKQALGPEYEAALQGAGPVDTTEVAANLDKLSTGLRGKAQTAAQQVRKMLDAAGGEGLDQNPATLLNTRNAIDGMLSEEKDSNVIRVLSATRKQIDDLIAEAVPGIKQVDAKYAELAKQGKAVDTGQTILGDGRDTPRPAELADAAKQGAQPLAEDVVGPSGVTFRLTQGARAEIDRIIGTKLNDRAALNSLFKGQTDWNYERLKTLFGPEKTDALYKILEGERQMAQTENMALSGSKTAAVSAAQKEVSPQDKIPGVLQSLADAHIGSAAARAAGKATGWATDAGREARNAKSAEALLGKGDGLRDPGTAKAVPIGAAADTISLDDIIAAIFGQLPAVQAPPPAKPSVSDEDIKAAIAAKLGEMGA